MLTTEQAQMLIAEGAQEFMREQGKLMDALSLLETLMVARCLIDKAIGPEVWKNPESQRQKHMLQAAGALLLGLQEHGSAMYTTYRLRRSLHPQQAQQHSALLENQFMLAEVRDAFNKCCCEAARLSPDCDTELWLKFRRALEKLGVTF